MGRAPVGVVTDAQDHPCVMRSMDTVVALLAFIQSVTGYALPSYAPQIVRADHARIESMLSCERAEAFASPQP